MSLSEMSKATYKAHRASTRVNGWRYTLAHIDCPLERDDMAALYQELQTNDWLALRAWFQRFDPAPVAFRLTSWTTLPKACK